MAAELRFGNPPSAPGGGVLRPTVALVAVRLGRRQANRAWACYGGNGIGQHQKREQWQKRPTASARPVRNSSASGLAPHFGLKKPTGRADRRVPCKRDPDEKIAVIAIYVE
jgi:hypothetical protein